MRKIKIFLTVLILYEFVVLTILQIPNYCVGFFNANFCNISFRYLLLCIMVPMLVWLFLWWLPDLSGKFCKKCQCETPELHENNHENITTENISSKYLERLLAKVIIMGIQNFAANHPRMQNIFDALVGASKKTSKTKK